MAKELRVGPLHRADSSDEALALARDWLAVNRPHGKVVTDDSSGQFVYRIHIRPQDGRWVARVEATWTPTPKAKGVA